MKQTIRSKLMVIASIIVLIIALFMSYMTYSIWTDKDIYQRILLVLLNTLGYVTAWVYYVNSKPIQ